MHLRTATLANDPLFYFNASWFDRIEVRLFRLAGCVNHDGVHWVPLPQGVFSILNGSGVAPIPFGTWLWCGGVGLEAPG